MASILKVDDLRGNTAAGDITITSEGGSATMQLQQGVAKAWVFTTDRTSYVPTRSLNVSSMTDNGTGRPETNFTNSFNDANIVGGFDGGNNRVVGSYTTDGGITTLTFAHLIYTVTSGVIADPNTGASGFGASYHGDLA